MKVDKQLFCTVGWSFIDCVGNAENVSSGDDWASNRRLKKPHDMLVYSNNREEVEQESENLKQSRERQTVGNPQLIYENSPGIGNYISIGHQPTEILSRFFGHCILMYFNFRLNPTLIGRNNQMPLIVFVRHTSTTSIVRIEIEITEEVLWLCLYT